MSHNESIEVTIIAKNNVSISLKHKSHSFNYIENNPTNVVTACKIDNYIKFLTGFEYELLYVEQNGRNQRAEHLKKGETLTFSPMYSDGQEPYSYEVFCATGSIGILSDFIDKFNFLFSKDSVKVTGFVHDVIPLSVRKLENPRVRKAIISIGIKVEKIKDEPKTWECQSVSELCETLAMSIRDLPESKVKKFVSTASRKIKLDDILSIVIARQYDFYCHDIGHLMHHDLKLEELAKTVLNSADEDRSAAMNQMRMHLNGSTQIKEQMLHEFKSEFTTEIRYLWNGSDYAIAYIATTIGNNRWFSDNAVGGEYFFIYPQKKSCENYAVIDLTYPLKPKETAVSKPREKKDYEESWEHFLLDPTFDHNDWQIGRNFNYPDLKMTISRDKDSTWRDYWLSLSSHKTGTERCETKREFSFTLFSFDGITHFMAPTFDAWKQENGESVGRDENAVWTIDDILKVLDLLNKCTKKLIL